MYFPFLKSVLVVDQVSSQRLAMGIYYTKAILHTCVLHLLITDHGYSTLLL